MAKYDGLIIPRSYNDYVNKSDPISVSQALQLTGVMDNAPTAQSTKPAKSGGIFAANAVIMADSATLSGVAISAGSVVRVLFTADLTGSDATTGLTLTYNDTAYAVKIGKNGALANFNAYEVESGVFKYLQAYTTLELMFDGTQFIIIGNPVVLSSADYTIYPDGYHTVNSVIDGNMTAVTSNAVTEWVNPSDKNYNNKNTQVFKINDIMWNNYTIIFFVGYIGNIGSVAGYVKRSDLTFRKFDGTDLGTSKPTITLNTSTRELKITSTTGGILLCALGAKHLRWE